ncbi:MAG: glycogen-binding domain-containing protein [Gemmatimonadales bacterium]
MSVSPVRPILNSALAAALLVPTGLAAQSAAALGAATRVGSLAGRDQTASLWFNGALALEGREWKLDFRSAGAMERGRLGTETVLLGRLTPALADRTRLVLGLDGIVDQPAGLDGSGVAEGRLGLRQALGGFQLEAGAKAVAWQSRGRRYFGGGYAATSLSLKGLTLSGEISRLQTTAGDLSAVDPSSAPGPLTQGADTSTFASASSSSVRTYLHAAIGLAWRAGPIAARGRLIQRTQVLQGEGTGWEAAVAVDAMPGVRVHASLGQAPLASGMFLPYRRQVALGFELVQKLGGTPANGLDASPGSGMAFDFTTSDDGSLISVSHPTADLVEVNGDFSDWQPRALIRVGPGRFQTRIVLPVGVHHLNIRYDGGPWQVPPGLASSDDGFGGRAGILIVR